MIRDICISDMWIRDMCSPPDFQIVEHGWLVEVGERGQVILSDKDVRVPEEEQVRARQFYYNTI